MSDIRIRIRKQAESQSYANQVFAIIGMMLTLVTLTLVVMLSARV